MHAIILGFITAFVLTFLAIPPIILVAKVKKLYDQPNDRSSHKEPTPSLGGIAIFGGAICGIILWTPLTVFSGLQYILGAMLIMFLIGMKDDLLPISPKQKFLAQVAAALILVYKANLRITTFDGILGIHEIPEMASFIVSMIAIVGIINAFNLIDGINGLAGSVGLLVCTVSGAWFFATGHVELAVLAFSVAGAIMAFLKYNLTPAKIFMGDTGALIIGTICAILALRFMELHAGLPVDSPYRFQAAPAIAFSVLILPIYDTLRVFIRRMLQGKSPFHPDKTHIHHMLLDLGLSHVQATTYLISANISFIVLAVLCSSWGNTPVLLLVLFLAYICSSMLNHYSTLRKQGLTQTN
jgi:UDP-GlcNAc:undecaprenyl-phosphate/decaprenyl-phosphate GlcNAc-1-phosphate transferase